MPIDEVDHRETAVKVLQDTKIASGLSPEVAGIVASTAIGVAQTHALLAIVERLDTLIGEVKKVAVSMERVNQQIDGTTLYVDKNHSFLQVEVKR